MRTEIKETAGQFVVLNKGSINQFYCSLLLKQTEDSVGYSINAFVDNFSVRQSLLRYSMSLEIALRDSNQLVDNSILKAGSIIEVSLFKSLDDPDHAKIIKAFYVTNIDSSIQSLTPNERVYDITAYTFSGVSNAWLFTNYYPSGSRPSDIIKDIVKKKFTAKPQEIGYSKSQPDIHWIDSENVLDTPMIFKQVAPFNAIANVIRRTIGKDKDSTYFFYEDIEGYKLRTLGDMTKQEYLDSAITYTLRADKTLFGDIKKDFYKILYLAQHNNSDYFNIMESGVYSSEVVFIDLLNRTIGNDNSRNLFQYSNNAHRESLLTTGTYDLFDINTEVFKKQGAPDPGASMIKDSYDISPSTKIAFSESAWGRKDYMQEKYPYDVAQRALFEQNKVSIEVYGNPEIRPGDIINVVIPKQVQQNGYSSRLTGNFLVTGVKHNVKGNIFQTIVDLHKDSYEKDVLTESKDNNNTLT